MDTRVHRSPATASLVSCLISVLMSLVIATSGKAQDTTSTFKAPPAQPRLSKRQVEKLRRRIDYIPAVNLVGALDRAGTTSVTGTTLQVSGDEETKFQLIRRRESAQAEVHARWDDLMIIRSGIGALRGGDSLVGSTYRAPGERRGGTFTKQYEIPLHPGDVIRIPAAVPHAVLVSGSEPLEYLLMKQRRQQLPIRWFGER